MASENLPRQNNSAPNAGAKSSKQPNHPEPPVPPTPAPQPEGQPTPYHGHITYKTKKGWWDKAKPYVESAGVVLLAIYTIFTILMYCANKKSADAAATAARIADQTLKTSQRPWVSAKSFELTAFRFETGPPPIPIGEHLVVGGVVTFVNTGNSAASEGLSFIWPEPNRTVVLEKEWEKACDFVERSRSGHAQHDPWPLGFLLTPGDKTEIPLGAGVVENISREEVAKGYFYILGCTLYKDQLNITHRLQWCFEPRIHDAPQENPLVLRSCQGFQRTD